MHREISAYILYLQQSNLSSKYEFNPISPGLNKYRNVIKPANIHSIVPIKFSYKQGMFYI